MSTKRELSDLQYATEAIGRGNWSIPTPGKRLEEVALAEQELPAAGAYVASVPIDVFKSRLVHLLITVTFGAAGGQVSFIPEISASGEDESWYPIAVTDGAVTVDDVVDPSPDDYGGSNYNTVIFRPLQILTGASDGTETMRMVVPIDVVGAKWFRVHAAEVGQIGTPSDITIKYSKSI